MTVETLPDIVTTLENAKGELEGMARLVDPETVSLAKAFEGLAAQSDMILNLAAAIVRCVQGDSVTSVLPKVQALGAAAAHFIAERLQVATGILQTVSTEADLLHQLSGVASSQEAIALEIKVLSVLTNIEVARLGAVGTGFQYLARELAQFSRSVIDDTQVLASHTDSRRAAIDETGRALSAELPRLRQELERIEADLGKALVAVDSSLTQLSKTPLRFKSSVEDIAREIAGVVAALQSQDITRQMNEHVQAAFSLMSARNRDATDSENLAEERPQTYAGLSIQIYQLRSISQTVSHWITQIRTCLGGILRISASELVGIAPEVHKQERHVSAQLARIELLESESEAYSNRIQRNLTGLSHLMELVREQLDRSRSIRDRLRLLAFNSIIEASHLGTQAHVILEISKSIKQVSVAWSQITDQSGKTLKEILKLVEKTNEVTKIFSQEGREKLREAQDQARAGLGNLRDAAEFATLQAREMKVPTAKMQEKITEIGCKADRLDSCFKSCHQVLARIESLKHQLEIDDPDVNQRFDATEVEKLFASSYTKELERDVLRAALRGKALPKAQPTLVGNSVELF